jgi:hypothetical protein
VGTALPREYGLSRGEMRFSRPGLKTIIGI